MLQFMPQHMGVAGMPSALMPQPGFGNPAWSPGIGPSGVVILPPTSAQMMAGTAFTGFPMPVSMGMGGPAGAAMYHHQQRRMHPAAFAAAAAKRRVVGRGPHAGGAGSAGSTQQGQVYGAVDAHLQQQPYIGLPPMYGTAVQQQAGGYGLPGSTPTSQAPSVSSAGGGGV